MFPASCAGGGGRGPGGASLPGTIEKNCRCDEHVKRIKDLEETLRETQVLPRGHTGMGGMGGSAIGCGMGFTHWGNVPATASPPHRFALRNGWG